MKRIKTNHFGFNNNNNNNNTWFIINGKLFLQTVLSKTIKCTTASNNYHPLFTSAYIY